MIVDFSKIDEKNEIKSVNQDGGYYAIKGFTYQFDKSIFEALSNQSKDIELEYIQDIGVDNYYIQVKYKETQKYSPSKIKIATKQLIECFVGDQNKHFKLYCYFNDKKPEIISLTKLELDKILGADKTKYAEKDKEAFVKNFTLEFSDNYEGQFKTLITLIKVSFKLKNDEEASTYHAIFRSCLFDIATKKNPKARKINFESLKDIAKSKERIIFDVAYVKYLKNDRYLKYLKNEFFTFKKVNIANKDRLFIIDVDRFTKDNDIIQIITNIKNRYFKQDSSPAPFICLYRINRLKAQVLKQKLWDKGLVFSDGTHFFDDKFRVNDLISNVYSASFRITFKLIFSQQLPILLKEKNIDEVYIFNTTNDQISIKMAGDFREFYVGQTKNIIKIIE